MTNDSDINGTLLRHQRESMGWTLADMAARACLSAKQIKQLEEGGDTAFYSSSIKLNVAKKVAQILGVTEDELFCRIKAPKGPAINESIEEIEAEQLALLASFESEPVREESKANVETTAVQSPLMADSIKAEEEKLDSPLGKNQDSALLQHHTIRHEQHSASEQLTELSQNTSAQNTESIAPVLKSVAQEARSESVSSSNFLSNADSQITQEPVGSGMSNGFKFLLLFLLFFAAVVVISPDLKNNLLEFGRQNGLFDSGNAPVSENPLTPAPTPDVSQADTPVESSLHPSVAPVASSPATVQVNKPNSTSNAPATAVLVAPSASAGALTPNNGVSNAAIPAQAPAASNSNSP
jgi:transcriptional regulator with XRE-family HTH domain